jgi:hypothetical protein
MSERDKVKLLALEIVNLIDNGDKENFITYGKIGDIIEELYAHRLSIIMYLVNKEKTNGKQPNNN